MKNQLTTIKVITLAGILSLTTLAPAYVNAAPEFAGESAGFEMKRGGKGGHKMLKRMARYLDLSEAQIDQIKAIKTQARTEHQTLRASMQSYFEEAKALKDQAVFDETAFNITYEKYNDTFKQIALAKAKTKHAIYYVLTAEQRVKWDEKMAERKAKREQKRQAKLNS